MLRWSLADLNRTILEAISLASEWAKESPFTHKHGAVALRKHKITGEGYNNKGSSALQRLYARKVGKKHNLHNHAEVAALNDANLDADTLVVVRVSKSGQLLNSKPCSICEELLKDSAVKRVYYSDGDGIQCLRL